MHCPSTSGFYFARGSGCEVLWWVCLSMGLSVCVSVCLSARISLKPHARSLPKFLCMLPMSVAWFFSSMFTIGRIAYRQEGVFFPTENALSAGKRGYGSAQRGQSMLSAIALFFLFLFLRDTLSWLAHSFWVHVNIAHLIKTFGGRKLECLCHHLPQVTITYLAFSTEHWLVTDRSIDRQTDTTP